MNGNHGIDKWHDTCDKECFDAKEDEWSNCEMLEKHGQWFNCQQPRELKLLKPRKENPVALPPLGYLSILVVLSHFMWVMSWVGIILSSMGMQWKRISAWGTSAVSTWKALKLITWPDPMVEGWSKKNLAKRILLIFALAIVVKNIMPRPRMHGTKEPVHRLL